MSKSSEVCVIIPVYNEGQVIKDTIEGVLKKYPYVVCVNDGSTDNSLDQIKQTNALVVDHPINMGQGAALQTGIEFALQFESFKYFVTFDADGQHSIKDVEVMVKVMTEQTVDIVVGSRFLGEAVNIKPLKKVILKLAVKFTNHFSGVRLTDTHNGLRVINRRFAEVINISMPGMAHASELIDKMGRGNWKYKEVPVKIIYTDYSKAKGQSMLNSINIFTDIILSRTKR